MKIKVKLWPGVIKIAINKITDDLFVELSPLLNNEAICTVANITLQGVKIKLLTLENKLKFNEKQQTLQLSLIEAYVVAALNLLGTDVSEQINKQLARMSSIIYSKSQKQVDNFDKTLSFITFTM